MLGARGMGREDCEEEEEEEEVVVVPPLELLVVAAVSCCWSLPCTLTSPFSKLDGEWRAESSTDALARFDLGAGLAKSCCTTTGDLERERDLESE